jgi:autotransporter-associated beta strand protein
MIGKLFACFSRHWKRSGLGLFGNGGRGSVRAAILVAVAALLFAFAVPANADTFNDWWCFHLWDVGSDPSSWHGPQWTSASIYWQVVLTSEVSSSGNGHLKFERDSWSRQAAANSGGFTVTPDNNVVFNGSVRLGGSAWSCADPSDIWINSMENTKTYVINLVDSGTVLADTCNDSMAAFVVNEVNHRNALVDLPSRVETSNDLSNVYLNSRSTAEYSGSNEELWFMYTTNNWTTRTFVEITNIATNTTLVLPIGSKVNFNSLIQWTVSSSANSDTATVSGTTSGSLNYDAMFIKRYEGRNHWVARTLLRNHSFEIEPRTNAPNVGAYNWKWGDPDTRGAFSHSVSREEWRAYSGYWMYAFKGTWAGAGSSGTAWQEVTNHLDAGAVWSAGAWFYNDAGFSCSGAKLKIEFYNGSGTRLGGNTNNFSGSLPGESWSYKSVGATSRVGTAWARFQMDTEGVGADGALQMDDAVLWAEQTAEPIWDGNGNTADWGNGTNWLGNQVPISGTNVTFYSGIASGTNINLNGDRTVLGLRFNESADTALNIRSNTLTINGGGIAVHSGAAGAHVIASAVALGAAQVWTNESSTALTVGGVVSGANALRKAGPGTVVLSGANTFSSGLYVDKGTIRLDGANAPGAGAVYVGTNATVELNAATTWRTNVFNLYGAGTNEWAGTIRNNIAGTITWAGDVVLYADARIRVDQGTFNTRTNLNASSYTLYITNSTDFRMTAGFLIGTKTTGDGAFHKSGVGDMWLRHGSELTGSIVLQQGLIRQYLANLPSGGTLIMKDGTTWRSDGNSARTILKATRLDGNVTLGHTGGTQPLTFSGNMDLNAGFRTITIPNNNTISGIISNGGFEKEGAGTLTLSGANTYSLGTRITAGRLQGDTTSLQGNITNNAAIEFNQAADGTYSGVLSGSGTLAKQGGGVVTLSGNNTFSGETWISNGVIQITHANSLGSTAAGTQVRANYTLRLSGGITTAAEPLTLRGYGNYGAGALDNASGHNTYAGPITLAAYARIRAENNTCLTVTGNINNDGYDLEPAGGGTNLWTGVISGGGALNKIDAGTLILTGASTYSGATTISNGTFVMNGTNTSSTVDVKSGTTMRGAGTVGNLTIGGLVDPGNTAGARGTLNAGAVTLQSGGGMRVDMSSVAGTAGTDWDLIDASGTITVNGSGTFTIYLYGSGTGFNSSQAYSWKIMDGSVSGFDAGRFAVNSDNFAHALDGGAFSVDENSLDLVFTPLSTDPPTVTTDAPSEITPYSAKGGGNVTDDGGDTVTERGVCWNTTGTPDTDDDKQAADAGGTGVFTNYISGLTPGETYYVRAYAINGNGTGYGDEEEFTAACFTNGPVVQAATGISDTNFTANWSALTGATSYRLDVSTNEFFDTLVLNPGFETGDHTSWSKTTQHAVTDTDAYSGTYSMVCTASATRSLSQVIPIPTADGSTAYEISYWYRVPSGDGTDIRIWSTWDNGLGSGDSLQPGTYNTSVDEWRQIVITNTPAVDATSFTFEVRIYSGSTVYVDDFSLREVGGDSSRFIAGYANRTVAGTSAVVTGLVEDTTYYYRVRGVNDYCTSPNSDTEDVTTKSMPDMDVLGTNGAVVADGDTTPTLADGTDFGTLAVSGGTITHTFTITNSGKALLSFEDVAIGGTHASDFTVVDQPGDNLLQNGDFALNGTPAQIHLATINNWSAWGESGWYNTDIDSQLSVKIWWDDTGIYQDWDCTPDTLYQLNVYARQRTAEPLVDWQGYMKVEFYDSGDGQLLAQELDYFLPEYPTNQWILLTGVATAPANTAYGRIILGIKNWSASAGGSCFFDDAAIYARSLDVGSTTTFRVTFDPSSSGTRTAKVFITNNAPGKAEYDFVIQGTGAVPDIAVLGTNLAVISNGDDTPSLLDGTDFGNVLVAGGTKTHTFTVTNTGGSALFVDDVAIDGTHAADFTVTTQPQTWVVSNMIPVNADFETGATGWSGPAANYAFLGEYYGLYPKRGTNFLVMWSDDLAFQDFAVVGKEHYTLSTWIASPATDGLNGDVHGEIKVEWLDVSGANDGTVFTSFGTNYCEIQIPPGAWYNLATNVTAPESAVTGRVVIAVANWGSGSGRGAFDHVQFFQQLSASTTTFQVTFDPSDIGARSATVYLTNNVSGESPYTFDVQGNGYYPDPVWDGGGANGNWDTVANWNEDVVPIAGTNVIFYSAITSGTNINLNGNRTVLGLRFNDSADTALNFTNSTLTINAGGIAASSGAAGNHVIASAIELGANQSWTNESTTDITLSGVVSGAGNVTKRGNSDGRFVLSGNNTFSGTLTISQGRVLITHANALGDAGAGTTVQSGPGLQMQGSITVAAEPLTLYGNGYWGGGALASVSGINTWSGPITLGASAYIHAQADSLTLNSATAITGSGYDIQFQGGGTIVVNSCIGTGAGAVTKIDAGTLVLNGTNTYSGATTLSFGTLIHNGTNTSTAVSVASGTTLMGVGSVGALTVTGTVAPGTNTVGIGRLAVNGLTMNNGSAFRVQLGDNSNTADRDYIQNSGGAPTISATVTVYVDSTLVSNWDSRDRSWNIITGNVGSAADFSLDQTTYWNEGSFPKNGGAFSLSASGGNLVLTFTPLPNPSAATVTGEGSEYITLDWTKHASYDVMITHRATNAPTAPTQGTGYSVGDAIGSAGTRVIYKGSGSSLEHIVLPGMAQHYAFYSYSGNYYSSGLTDDAFMPAYRDGEIVEPFSYTNSATSSVHFDAKTGGSGWTNAWAVSTDGSASWSIIAKDDTSDGRPEFVDAPSNQVAISGNRAFIDLMGGSRWGIATRGIQTVNSGTIFVSAIVAYRYQGESDGTDRWMTLALMNGETEELEFGKVYDGRRALTIRRNSSNAASGYSVNPYDSSADNWYWIVLKYDFDNDVAELKGFYQSQNIPLAEPASWDAEWSSLSLDRVTGIRLKAGGDTEWLGGALFDEVRVATTWNELLGITGVDMTNYLVGVTNHVSDGQVTGGTFNVSVHLYADDGVETTNTQGDFFRPNFDILNNTSVQILTDQVFATFTRISPTTVIASNTVHAGYWPGTLGTYTIRVSAINSNGVAALDADTLENGTPTSFTVYDDDNVLPVYLAPSNAIRNGGFENSGGPWTQSWWGTAWFSPEAAEIGNFGAYVWNEDSGIDQWVTLEAEETYTVSVRARHDGSLSHAMLMKYEAWEAGSPYTYAIETNMQPTMTANWQTYSMTFTVPAGTLSNKIVFFSLDNSGAGSGMTYLDNALLQKSSIRAEPLFVRIGDDTYVPYPLRSDTNAIVRVTDGDLRAVNDSDNSFRLFLAGHDTGSGLSRGTTDNLSQMNVDIGSWVTDNAGAYYETESSSYAGTLSPGASNVWRWTAFDGSAVDTLFGTNKITASIPDADNDRNDDREWLIDHQVGYLAVVDDDRDYPVIAWNNILTNGSFDGNGAGWTEYGQGEYGFDDWAAESGNWGLWMREAGQRGAFMDADASPGNVYTFSVRAKVNGSGFNPNSCYIKAEVYDVDTNKLVETEVEIKSFLTAEWQTFTVAVTSPANTVWARGVMGVWKDPMTGTNIVMFDNANLAEDAGPLKVMIGGTVITPSEQTTNALFVISSTALTNVSAGNPLRLIFGAYDVGSGLSRGTDDTANQAHISIGTAIQTNNAQYDSSESSAYEATYAGGATSTWKFTSFSEGQFSAMISAVTNPIIMTIRDADFDRTDDRLSSTNALFGYLVVTSPPASQVGMIYDWFPNSGRLYNQGGGTGWGTNLWFCSDDDLHVYDSGSFTTNKWSCPDTQVNKAKLVATENGSIRYATRQFGTNFTSGKVYFYWIQNFDNTGGGNSAYAGLYIMSNDTEEVFIGKTPGHTTLGLAWWAGEPMTNSPREMVNGMGKDYLVVARYDFATRELSANVYATNEIIAEEPIGYWDVTTTLGEGDITFINGVRIKGGVHNDNDNSIGNMYFDEIRVGTNWYEVARKDGEEQAPAMADGPIPSLIFVGTNYTVGATNNLTITDGELANLTDPIDFAVIWSNQYGVFMTNQNESFNIGSRSGRVNPNWDPITKGQATNALGMDSNFTGFVGYNGAIIVTTYVQNAFNITDAEVGDTFYITMSGENNNLNGGTFTAPNGADDVPFWRAITINRDVQFYVTDDDNDSPVAGNLLQNPGFEEQDGANENDALHWWRYENAGRNDWASRNGSQGMGWWSYDDWYGGFGQDVYVDLVNGDVVAFSIWGKAETGFVGKVGMEEAWIKVEFWAGGSRVYTVTNSVYGQLVNNYNKWTEHRFVYTNTQNGITLVKPIVGYGNVEGYETGAVMWDDATFTKGARPLRVLIGDTDRSDLTPGVTVHTLTDADLAGVSGGSPLKLVIEGYDTYSGLARGITGADSNTVIHVSTLTTNNVSNYESAGSSSPTRSYGSTNLVVGFFLAASS